MRDSPRDSREEPARGSGPARGSSPARRRRRHDTDSDSDSDSRGSGSSGTSSSGRARRGRDATRDLEGAKAAKKERKRARKAAKKARKRERREAKREAKRARRDETRGGGGPRDEKESGLESAADVPPRGGLEVRSREIAEAERAARAERERLAAEAARAAAEEEARAAEEETAAADRHRDRDRDAPPASAASSPPDPSPDPSPSPSAVPGFGAAMTLEQYRAMAARNPHLKGTVHATPTARKAEADEKTSKGWWPCQSYRCTKGGRDGELNPRHAEKCKRCGAMRPLGAGLGGTFNARMTDAQYAANQSARRGK